MIEAMQPKEEPPMEVLGWVPVEERLPERKMRVLVAIRGCVVWGGSYRPDTKKKFVLDGSDAFQRMNFLKGITHWMPLPAPPG
jgi:hypothetical protein